MPITARQLLDTFDGEVVAIEPRRITVDFPTTADFDQADEVWVSSDLCAFAWRRTAPDERHHLADDLTQVDTYPDGRSVRRAYRRLDPWWYLWLYRSMQRLQRRADAGAIASDAWEEMRRRFNILWRYGQANWTDARMRQLHSSHVAADYRPPQIYRPTVGEVHT